MKTPRIANAIGQIDDDLVAGAAKCKTKNKKHWLIHIFLSVLRLQIAVLSDGQFRHQLLQV